MGSSDSEPRRIPALEPDLGRPGRSRSTSIGWPSTRRRVPGGARHAVGRGRRRRWPRGDRACSTCPARSGCATRSFGSAGIRIRPTRGHAGHLRADRALSHRARAARLIACAGLLPDRRGPGAAAARRGRTARAGDHHRREVRRLGRGQDADRTHALLRDSRQHRGLRGVRATGMAPRSNRSSDVPVTFVPHLVPLDRGHPRDDLRAAAAGRRRRRRLTRTLDAGVCGRAVRAADRRRSAGDQARRPHELLRHRLARRSPDGGQLVMVVVHRQPGEGRGRPGDPELQRRVRLRRSDGAATDAWRRS